MCCCILLSRRFFKVASISRTKICPSALVFEYFWFKLIHIYHAVISAAIVNNTEVIQNSSSKQYSECFLCFFNFNFYLLQYSLSKYSFKLLCNKNNFNISFSKKSFSTKRTMQDFICLFVPPFSTVSLYELI